MVPPIEVIAYNRLAFGPRPGDLDGLREVGLAKWLDEQLKPDDAADTDSNRRLGAATLKIGYKAGADGMGRGWDALPDEERPLRTLSQPIGELWHLADYAKPVAYEERVRPIQEVRAATWIRAVYSRWQLREVMADFWHNHFNINAVDTDVSISVGFPTYDREVIRRHCFGNFRQLLEGVATSVPMLRYLNNSSSRASPANENFARELFELHTLGAENYLNHLYNRWRDVPGAAEGKPAGYIDQDVYEAARAFTGWTVAGGQWARDNETLPATGAFMYYDGWHDHYQKRVLASEFDPNQPPMSDGRKVLDLVASHPGTARHVCTKLCRRLVADEPPVEVIEKAVAAWNQHADAPDQIARTIRAIVLSEEFARTWGAKVKRPLEFVASLLRATDADFMPNIDFLWGADQTGQRLFGWPTPAGHPDHTGNWVGTNTMLYRWNFPLMIVSGWNRAIRVNLLRAMPADVVTCRQACDFWVSRILGYTPEPAVYDKLLAYASKGSAPDQPLPGSDPQIVERVCGLVALTAMTPQFHLR